MAKRKNNDKNNLILKELLADPCQSARKIAKKLKMHPATVAKKIEEMKKEGIIKGVVLLLDLEKIGYPIMAITQVKYKLGKHNTDELMKIKNVLSVYEIIGEYDALVFFVAKNRAHLKDTIHRIATMKNVERTNTTIILRIVGERLNPAL